jgi:ABC-2 type transport system permease protein
MIHGWDQFPLVLPVSLRRRVHNLSVHGNPFDIVTVANSSVSNCIVDSARLGIVITSVAKDQETAQMMMTLMFPMMFLSGVFFPIQQMPWYMQTISKMLPLTYASQALRKVMVLGAGIPAISAELTILIVFGVVMTAIAMPVFRRMMTR